MKPLTELTVEEASTEIVQNTDYFRSDSGYFMEVNGRRFFPCEDGLVEAEHEIVECGSYQDDYTEIMCLYRAYDDDIFEEEIKKIKLEAERKIEEVKKLITYLKDKQ